MPKTTNYQMGKSLKLHNFFNHLIFFLHFSEDKDDHTKSECSNLQSVGAISTSNVAPTAVQERGMQPFQLSSSNFDNKLFPDVDEDGYSIQPRDTPTWDEKHKHSDKSNTPN